MIRLTNYILPLTPMMKVKFSGFSKNPEVKKMFENDPLVYN